MMQSPHITQVVGAAQLRACSNCSRAKAKCMPQSNDISSEQCARCFRLKKNCVTQLRAKRKQRGPNATSTTELEAKIESLVNLLSAAQVPKPVQAENNGGSDNTSINHSTNLSCKAIDGLNNESTSYHLVTGLPSRTGASSPSTTYSRTYTPTDTLSIQSGNAPPTKISEELLQIFRSQFQILTPYVVLPPNVTAKDLQSHQPWLYRMITIVASSNEHLQQVESGKCFLSEVSTAILVRGERSLDMLQALLVYNSWSYLYAAVLLHCQSSGIMQLVIALVFDLALNRAIRIDIETDKLLAEVATRNGKSSGPRETDKSLAERRALLYAFYLTSTVSTFIRKADGLQSSPYIEYNCTVRVFQGTGYFILQNAAEYEADLILVACVRFQSIADSVYRELPKRHINSDGRNAPLWMHNTQLQNELHNMYSNLAVDIQNHAITKMTYHSVEALLLDTAMTETMINQSYDPRRVDLSWSCLMAGKSVLDAFLDDPLSAYHGIPFTKMCHLSSTLMNLVKFAFFENPGWELTHVREMIKLECYFDSLIALAEQAGATIDTAQSAPTDESFLTKCAKALIWVKGWYKLKIESRSVEGQSTTQHPVDMMELIPPLDIPHNNTMDYMDDHSWQELMMEFNYMPMAQAGSSYTF